MGLKNIPIEAFPAQYWRFLEGKSDENGTLSVAKAYKSVPVLHRAIDIRAKAISSLPYLLMRGEEDVSTQPDVELFMRKLRPLLMSVEMNLCIYGSAYLLIERNKYGLNGKLRSLLPLSIKPVYDVNKGLTGFERVIKNEKMFIPLTDIIYFWMPNHEFETGPGIAPGEVALSSASTLFFLDTFLENFWKRGAIKATLLSVSGPTQQAEMEKLENWWKRFMSGVKNAFNTVAIRGDIKPIIVGDTLKDTVNPELTQQARTDTLTALGVPHSLVLSNAATYATAKVDTLSFYENTVVPQAVMICDALNEQLLDKVNIRMVPRPDKLETYQRDELDKAQGLMTLVGTPILTVDEARDMMGYGPLANVEMQPEPTDLTTETNTIPESGAASDAVNVETANPKSITKIDLDRWKSKSIKSLRAGRTADVKFDSDEISFSDKYHLKNMLFDVNDIESIHQVFQSFKKESGSKLHPDEVQLYTSLVNLGKTKIKQIMLNRNYSEISELYVMQVSDLLLSQMIELFPVMFDEIKNKFAIEIDSVEFMNYIKPIFDAYIRKLQQKLNATNYNFYNLYLTNNDVTQLLLEVPFGQRRAEIIAVTETTALKSLITMNLYNYLQATNNAFKLVWKTAADEIICAFCKDLNNRVYGETVIITPPAHPYCRCALQIEAK